MAYNNEAKNSMLDHLASEISHVALYDENGNELSGGSPEYERQTVNWNLASNGEITASNEPEFNVPGNTTVSEVAFFDALTEGTEYATSSVVDETYSQQGTYTLTNITLDLNK